MVADTSPLNYLALIGFLDIVPALFGSVLIPTAVDLELKAAETPPTVRALIGSALPWLSVQTVPFNTDPDLAHLDLGEREVILLGRSLDAGLVLMDERIGVAAARSRGLSATGTLGLLDRASRRGLLNLTEAVSRLRGTNFRCRPALLDELLAQHRDL